jgi:hypothetical protein
LGWVDSFGGAYLCLRLCLCLIIRVATPQHQPTNQPTKIPRYHNNNHNTTTTNRPTTRYKLRKHRKNDGEAYRRLELLRRDFKQVQDLLALVRKRCVVSDGWLRSGGVGGCMWICAWVCGCCGCGLGWVDGWVGGRMDG